MNLILNLTFVVLCCFGPMTAKDRADLSEEKLQRFSSDVVVGTVVRVFKETSSDGSFETTLYVTEIAVEEVAHGKSLKKGDRVFAKHYSKSWIGEGRIPTGWNGIYGFPAGMRVKAFLRGKPSRGFHITEPNGLIHSPDTVELGAAEMKILNRHYRALCMVYGNSPLLTKIKEKSTIRVLAVQRLIETINWDLAKISAADAKSIESLSKRIEDLDQLDGDKHSDEIKSFRSKIADWQGSGG